MRAVELRPPLPPPLSHDGIAFVMPAAAISEPAPEALAAIAAALSTLLPAGDFAVSPEGRLVVHPAATDSLWHRSGLLDAMERTPQR